MTKMKKAILLFFAMTLLSGGPARADDPVTKLGRGVENVVTSPVEFLTQYLVVSEGGNPVAGLVGGTLFGAGMTVVRILGGVYEIITFPFPMPSDYEPLLDPGTPLQALHQIN